MNGDRSRETGSAELTCRDVVELVTDYLEDRLAEPDRRRFERHLAGCAACAVYLDQMRRTIRLLGRLTEDSIDPAARREILARFRDWRRGGGSTRSPGADAEPIGRD